MRDFVLAIHVMLRCFFMLNTVHSCCSVILDFCLLSNSSVWRSFQHILSTWWASTPLSPRFFLQTTTANEPHILTGREVPKPRFPSCATGDGSRIEEVGQGPCTATYSVSSSWAPASTAIEASSDFSGKAATLGYWKLQRQDWRFQRWDATMRYFKFHLPCNR